MSAERRPRFLRAPWASDHDEESRAALQNRLTLLWRVMFWAFCVLLGTQFLLYDTVVGYPHIKPIHQNAIYVIGTAALAIMAVIWRGFLVRRQLSMRQLYGIDLFYAGGAGLVLAAAAVCAWNFPPAHYVCLIYAAFAVFTRTIIVPSSGKRTLATSLTTFAPVIAAAMWLAAKVDVIAPGPVFALSAAILAGVAVLLAITGSELIYGLRRQASAAIQLGRYTLERKIGEGGMGSVHLARHLTLRRPTAVKLLPPDRNRPEDLERFEREVQHMSELTHPNTVAVYDYGHNPDGVFYYAMEYLGGGLDLENLVRRFGAQPSKRVAHILEQVCGALGEAHAKPIIHRDIKPANIILCERGGVPDVAKVVDYGLVKEIEADTGASTQLVVGTPTYIAPESMTDPSAIGPPTDLYALGAVGYFLVTGRPVFQGKTAVEVLTQHITAAPRPPSEVTTRTIAPELEAIILKCLAKRPSDRYANARAMAEALRAVPASEDWSEEMARAWWDKMRASEDNAAAASSQPTVTVQIDIDHRDLQVTRR